MGLQFLKSLWFWFFLLFFMFPFFNCEVLYGLVLGPLVFICHIISHSHSALILTQMWLPNADFQSWSLCLGPVLIMFISILITFYCKFNTYQKLPWIHNLPCKIIHLSFSSNIQTWNLRATLTLPLLQPANFPLCVKVLPESVAIWV